MNLNISQPQRLKAVFIATVLGAAAIEGTVLAHTHHVATGKDAFLHYQVDSTDELIQALKKNPELRRNYAKHFGIPEDQVVDFVKRSLVAYRLPEGRSVTTYGVTKSGHIYPVHAYLKKGTLVWATRSGLPVLKWACANPLTKHLPGTLLSIRPKSTRGGVPRHLPRVASVPANELPVELPAIPATELPVPPLTPPEATASSALTLPPFLSGTTAANVPAIAAVSVPVTTSGGHGGSLLPLIPILVGIGSIGHQSSGGSSPVPVASPTPGGSTGLPTPTPGGSISVPTPTPGGTTTLPTPTPSGPSGIIPTPTPSGPSGVIPTPTPSGGTSTSPTPTPSGGTSPIPTPTPSGGTGPIPTPTPSNGSGPIPTPTPSGGTGLIPTPTPSVPPVQPTPTPFNQPTPPPTPPPSSQPHGPGGGSTVPEPGSVALTLIVGLPVAAGLIGRRRRN